MASIVLGDAWIGSMPEGSSPAARVVARERREVERSLERAREQIALWREEKEYADQVRALRNVFQDGLGI